MIEPRECPHGSLARSCELCERDAIITDLRAALAAANERATRAETAWHSGWHVSGTPGAWPGAWVAGCPKCADQGMPVWPEVLS